jgi:hypothetical protein
MNSIVSKLRDKSFWAGLMLGTFGIEDPASFRDVEQWRSPVGEPGLREAFTSTGYVHMPNLQPRADTERLAEAVRRLVNANFPPVFAMVYDEFWKPVYALGEVLKAGFGSDYRMLPDIWLWHVDPARDESGWRPHRERGHEALFPDGRPKSLSVWMALSKATPRNSCMYIVPADRDPTYGTAEDTKWNFALPDVRALPAEAGDVFMWTQALLHWGGHAMPCSEPPRISIAFEFQHAGVEPFDHPLIEPLAIVPFEDRLRLIGKQLLQYQHMVPLSPDLEAAARELIKTPAVALGRMMLPEKYT